MKTYIWHLWLAIDQLANAILAGSADETLSARAWRTEQRGRILGKWLRPCIDALFVCLTLGRQRDHCAGAYRAELRRKHLPQEYKVETSARKQI